MAHGFAKQSGGYIRIHSDVGQGSSIKLYLPRGKLDAAQPSDFVTGSASKGQGETILIVDDSETLRSVMMQVVMELGYRGLDAPDAKDAIAVLQTDHQIKLLVTDVGLPNMNGRQLAEIARQLRPELRVLFVTGYAENAAVRGEFLGAGMEMLTKPSHSTRSARRSRRC